MSRWTLQYPVVCQKAVYFILVLVGEFEMKTLPQYRLTGSLIIILENLSPTVPAKPWKILFSHIV